MTTFLIVLLFAFVFLLILIMFLFLKKIVIKINKVSKDYFLDKLQVYDDLINEKEKVLRDLEEKSKKIKDSTIEEQNDSSSQNVYLYDIKSIDYQYEDILKKMKDIDKKFQINNRKIIEDFIQKHFNEDEVAYYHYLEDIRKKFNKEFIYRLSSRSSIEQEKVVRGYFEKDSRILDEYLKRKHRLNILSFVSCLDKEIAKNDPFIYVYVGDSSIQYNSLHPYIITKVDESIYRGILIKYKDKVYDYSLR